MSSLLMAEGPAQHTGEAKQRIISAGQAIRRGAGTDQLTLDAKCSGLKRNEIDVFESGAINRLAKHECLPASLKREHQGK
jgi:hypothetical protein